MPTEPVALARVAAEPITVQECEQAVLSSRHGAVVTFAGVVRDHDDGRGVLRLAYDAHPDAPAALLAATHRVTQRWPDVRVAVAHRVGDLAVGDLALACAVASAHRSAAFSACAALVDDIKATVPIWKEQTFVDGSSEWVASLG
ncbi:molybdenum cofactor biosynthesis protein MoaE [Rathayibacter toxicus]|uniref:Molybdenum cofactor biosynthesis protein MoaE n=1 Tax=Rathayibacter toxicus TaxID=145458 RepID=A0A0C5BH83_9MICO|nr:molybdenum cofactor biosynthesis protein MoaE [Rathayibacter toxicus]AJM77545.1 molybdenum cofactor biosynthesis protein MoaE [Rathayibacter toxicus]ALS56533.1 molybdenum cofactor biosynthesis protein MoaE [Rathayibacter toxicus]KKM44632.1 molybdenum cofactor biosynthesis protein MoaE [Rathayibacter toxicus]PPG21641.1 molybdenum cofactor biosynthesis protein MoaE [Rathayibacter toxicus]PPG46603.1 molybdenum cofactor biosynthesis protein MoaE [Rathayibacter toxicus]